MTSIIPSCSPIRRSGGPAQAAGQEIHLHQRFPAACGEDRRAARLPGAFQGIFDIVAANLVPKPERETYDRFVKRFRVAPERAAMFEDLTRNLLVPKAVGMATVLVVPPGTREVFHGEWEYEGRDDDHIDFVTDDLARFIGQIADAIGAERAPEQARRERPSRFAIRRRSLCRRHRAGAP